MARRSLIAIMLLGFIGAVAVPAAQAFECPTRQKEARQFLYKARAASRQVTDPAKLGTIEELLERAEEKLNQSEMTHYGAKSTADHATSVRLAYEALGDSKEAYYLATK